MTTENNKNDPCRGSDTKREQAKDSDPDHIALEGLIGREGLFGGGEGQAMSEIQAKAQTPANGLLSQVFDLQLSETFLDTSNPDYFDEPTDKAYNWPPKTLTDITKPTKVFRQLEDIPFYANRPVRIGDITDTLLLANPRADLDLVNRAYVRAAVAHKDKNRHSGEPYLSHPLAVAGILAEMGLDDITVAAGLLHDTVEDTTMTIEDLVEEFGPDVARIVNGVTKIAKFNFTSETERQAINLRKIIIAMLDDLRVIFVKLADRLHNMRTLGYMSADKQAKISRETLDFFAPLASRLGIHKIQAELEDLALFYLNPIEYETIRNSLSLASKDRKNFVSEVKEYLAEKMKEWNINCEIEGRPKHIYSIHKKMVSQNLPIEQIYDLVAFRIIVSDVQSCYTTLCVIHQLFKPIPGRFKDYINLPKSNGYQSLHTAVIGLHKYRMEIQIRTKAMHQVAEEGVAAHWRYKEGTTTEELARINALRSRLNWQSSDDPKRFLNDLRESLATDEFIIVMTPDGKPIDLPVKATVLDFAYAIHTSIGHHCHAARVNDANYPIREKLETGDVVRIITSPKANVKPDWLHSVVTAKARQRIRQYLANENKIALTEKGEQIIKNVMARNKLSKSKLTHDILASLGFAKIEDLNYAVAAEKFKVEEIIKAIKPGHEITPPEPEKPLALPVTRVEHTERLTPMILVDGHENIAVNFPKCCFPMPGEPIRGYLTHYKGVSIHSDKCQALASLDKNRFINVSWANDQPTETTTDIFIKVKLFDKKYIPNVISALVSNSARIADFQQSIDNPNQIWFRVPVKDYSQCQVLLASLTAMEWEVAQVERFQPPFIPFPPDEV